MHHVTRPSSANGFLIFLTLWIKILLSLLDLVGKCHASVSLIPKWGSPRNDKRGYSEKNTLSPAVNVPV